MPLSNSIYRKEESLSEKGKDQESQQDAPVSPELQPRPAKAKRTATGNLTPKSSGLNGLKVRAKLDVDSSGL